MNRWTLGLAVLFLSFTVNAGGALASPAFASVAWGTPQPKVISALSKSGFHFVKIDSEGDLDLSGSINGQKVAIFEFLTPAKRLVKTQVSFLTSDDEALDFYSQMKQTLTEKYGEPAKQFGFWMDPYTDSDSESDHETALAVGKGVFSSFWDFADHGSVYMGISKNLSIDVNYESPEWAAELNRRKNSGNSVL